MNALRNALSIGLLLIACIAGLRVNMLLAEAGRALGSVESSASELLASATSMLRLAQSTLATQQGYYRDSASHIKALTRAAAIDAILLGRLIQNTDTRLDRITSAAEASLDSASDAATAFAKQTQTVGEESGALLEAATETTKNAGALVGDPALQQSLANLEASSENLQKTTAEASEAMGYIRDMLSPAKKSFWRRLLELLIPRPTISVP